MFQFFHLKSLPPLQSVPNSACAFLYFDECAICIVVAKILCRFYVMEYLFAYFDRRTHVHSILNEIMSRHICCCSLNVVQPLLLNILGPYVFAYNRANTRTYLTFPNYEFGKGQHAFYPMKLSRFREKVRFVRNTKIS